MDKKLKRNILKGTAATSIGTVSGMFFQFLTIMIMTRYVSKDDLGIYFLIIVIVNMFNIFGGLGLELTMVKSIASDNDQESRDVLIPVLLLRMLGCILFGAVFIFTGRYILHFFDDRIYQYIWYIAAIFILANFRDLFYKLMQGLNLFKQYSIVNVASSVFRAAIIFIFILLTKLNIKYLLIIEILATAQPLLHQILVIPFGKYIKVRPTVGTFRRIIKFSTPLYANNLVVFFNGRINILVIGAYLNPASIANFSVANKLPTAFAKVFSSFLIVYFPNLVKLFADGDKKNAVKLVEKSMAIFSITVALAVVFSFCFRNELVTLLFSARYTEVSIAFALLVLNFFIKELASLLGNPFVPAGYPSVPATVNTFGSVAGIGLCFLFIPIYGYVGAVFASLAKNILSTVLFYLYSVKYEINPRINSFLKPAVLFLLLPISLLITGEFSILLNAVLFVTSLILGWFISDEMKKGIKFFIKSIRDFNLVKGKLL